MLLLADRSPGQMPPSGTSTVVHGDKNDLDLGFATTTPASGLVANVKATLAHWERPGHRGPHP
jgi:hypothetical protein